MGDPGARHLSRLDGSGRIDALSHWVASDHFEELGRPPRLEHGGFGLLTVGNLRKPRWWAMELLERLGESRVVVTTPGMRMTTAL